MSMSPRQVTQFLSTHCTEIEMGKALRSDLNETNEGHHFLLPDQTNLGIVQFKSKHEIICYVTCNINGKWVFFGNVVMEHQRNFKSTFRTDYGINERKPGNFMPWIASVLNAL